MLKLKLAVLDGDRIYLERMGGFLLKYYADRIEAHMFSERKDAIEAAKEERFDIFLVSAEYKTACEFLNDRRLTVFLTDTADITEYNGIPAVYRYQKAGAVISGILDLYSDRLSESASVSRSRKQNGRLTLFLSGNEGAGASAVCAAFCEYLASGRRKTLYLNLKQTGSANDIFDDPTPDGSLTDVIFALKSKKPGISLKLESLLRRNEDGICFYRKCLNCLDYSELSAEELDILLNETGSLFDDVSVTCDFDLSDRFIRLVERADKIIMVTADDDNASEILKRKKEIMKDIEKRRIKNMAEINLIVNKAFSDRRCDDDIRVLGSLPVYDPGMSELSKIRSISASGIFEGLYS